MMPLNMATLQAATGLQGIPACRELRDRLPQDAPVFMWGVVPGSADYCALVATKLRLREGLGGVWVVRSDLPGDELSVLVNRAASRTVQPA